MTPGSCRAIVLMQASRDLGAPSPPDTPGDHPPHPPNSALIYSNVGE